MSHSQFFASCFLFFLPFLLFLEGYESTQSPFPLALSLSYCLVIFWQVWVDPEPFSSCFIFLCFWLFLDEYESTPSPLPANPSLTLYDVEKVMVEAGAPLTMLQVSVLYEHPHNIRTFSRAILLRVQKICTKSPKIYSGGKPDRTLNCNFCFLECKRALI